MHTPYAIGIDMSKNTFHAAFDETMVRVFENTPAGVASFFAVLSGLGMDNEETTIGVEATGAYHLILCAQCALSGRRIVVINPLETYHMIQAQSLRRVKTDRKDAIAIRAMVALGRGYPYTDTADAIALKALIVERNGLIAMRSALAGQGEAHAAKQKAVPLPLHDTFSPILAALRKEIRAMERLFASHRPETQALLRSIPGVGAITAATLVAFVGDISRFSSPEKLVAYIGLDCRVQESGTSVHGKGYISKRGSGRLRHTLFNATLTARQQNPELKLYFKKKIGEGKHYFSAMCATERKLIHLIYAVWKRNKPFEKRESPMSPLT